MADAALKLDDTKTSYWRIDVSIFLRYPVIRIYLHDQTTYALMTDSCRNMGSGCTQIHCICEKRCVNVPSTLVDKHYE